jgi:hypothetical protein
MQFLISTTGTDVLVSDLGVFIPHPTIDRDLSIEFTPEEIAKSASLTYNITNGYLTLRLESLEYGVYDVEPDKYDSYSLLQQSLAPELVEKYVLERELQASFSDTPVVADSFPKSISSTTAVTNLLVCNTAKFQDWRVAVGDDVYIFGSSFNDGYYKVANVIDQRKITTVEPLVTSVSSGYIYILNPAGSTKVGVKDTTFSVISGTNLQTVLESIDTSLANIGTPVLPGDHDNYDTLVHNLAEDYYEEYTYTGNVITNNTIWSNISKVLKIREYQYIYVLNKLYQEIQIQYNNSGVEVQRLVKTYNYSGNKVASISVTETGSPIPTDHEEYDTLVHNLAETSFEEYIYYNELVSKIIVWTNALKVLKIREHQYSYSGGKIVQSIDIQYNNAGTEIERLTNNYNYSSNKLVNINVVESV